MNLIPAHAPEYAAAVNGLFREYAASMGLDLSFQGFAEELAGLPGKYAPPEGRLILARVQNADAGCVALRKIGDNTCEMKRLYVRPGFQGRGIGKALARCVIEEARGIGYRQMLLDTLASMHSAIDLYRSLGFTETAPYYHNPLPDARFFQLTIS